ncbi:MAG: tetratricopeptide repeat protein [Selenomonadaceae bacterium]|nr:tetratricopeptide repeat protein [Selenomonadaceae bacterium]
MKKVNMYFTQVIVISLPEIFHRHFFLLEEKSVKLREKALDASDTALARTYNDAGVVSLWLNDIDKAMDYFNKAIKVLESTAPDDPNAANVFANVGTAYANLGDYDKAIMLKKR